MIDQSIRWGQSPPISETPINVRYGSSRSRISRVEQVLIFSTIVMIPLESNLPTVAGMSGVFLLFGALAAYVILNRPRILAQTWYHPCFVAAYAFIGISALLEFASPLSEYGVILRFAQMLGGAVCLAVLCRDRSALTAGLYGYIAAALWVSIYLYLTSYGTIKEKGPADDYQQATHVREAAFSDGALQPNINS